MSPLAFARPMWPATLRALRELTRLALATLVLTVALGATVASAPPHRSAVDLPARPAAATLVDRPSAEPIWVTDEVSVEQVRATTSTRSERAETRPAAATTISASSAAAIPAAAIPAEVARDQAAAGEGEPARRGPPTA